MKSILCIFLLLIAITFISCSNNLPRKKLDLNVIENNDIKLEQYKISEISFIHEFIDLTDKRWNDTERIFEGNTGIIDSLFIRNDSIIILTSFKNQVIYDLAAIKFGYKIVLKNK